MREKLKGIKQPYHPGSDKRGSDVSQWPPTEVFFCCALHSGEEERLKLSLLER